ncbi:MAG: hypothetical protein R3C14_38445 [Caldilineaceae bacterium]
MTVALLLDQYTLPEKGAVELYLNRSFEIKISAEEARRQVKRWLLNEVSYMLTTQAPTMMVGDRVVWRVPILLTAPHIGHVGTVGAVHVDVESGAMDSSSTCKTALLDEARRLADAMPAYQPRVTTPQRLLLSNFKPTHSPGKPEGNPLTLLPTE